jgi:hypothetical protein
MQCDHGYGRRKMTEQYQWQESRTHEQENEKMKKMKDPQENNILVMKYSRTDGLHQENNMHSHPLSHMGDHIFFTINDLHVGKTMSIKFTPQDPSSLPPFLDREEADSIPFSMTELPKLFQLFSISQASPQAKAIENTLKECESKPIKGETKFCATSLESMVDYVHDIFGSQTHFKILTTTRSSKSTTLQHNYTFQEVKEVSTSNVVACHTAPYPYAVYQCHSQKSKKKVFKISLRGVLDEERVITAIFVCHMDTSAWPPNHISFRLLGLKPGTSSSLGSLLSNLIDHVSICLCVYEGDL